MSSRRPALSRRSANGFSNGHPNLKTSRSAAIGMDRLRTRIKELQGQVEGLQQEHDRFTWVFDAMPVGYVLMDGEGFVHDSKGRVDKMLGFRPGMPKKGSLMRLLKPEDVPAFLEHLRRCRSAQAPVTTEVRLRSGARRGLPVEIVSLPSEPGRNGDQLYRTAIVDLTQRRATEQKLNDTLQSFESLLDTVEGVVWEASADTLNVTFVNRYAEKMLGYPVSQWLQPGFWERHIYVDDRERVMQEVARALHERTNTTLEYRAFTVDRRLLWIHDRVGIRERDGKLRLLGIAVDMTAQKNAENELDKERASLELRVAERTAQLQSTISELEAFSYSLSHDMRAPLRAMEGYTQLLRNILAEKLGPKELDFFGRIMASAERLDNLIQDVLQYSRVARAPLELKEIEVEKIVDQVISDYPALQSPAAKIEVKKPLLPVLGHEAFLTQSISNLLSNAVKFVAPGVKPKVVVSTTAHGNQVRLCIEDNGIGIAPENQRQIFGIFQRLHANSVYPGTGIGLAIVQKAVERMGGSLGVHSAVGQGSAFWLQLRGVEQ